MKPEEDKVICKHEWYDFYGGMGTDKDDPTLALQAFYCKFCLEIRIKTYNQSRYKLNLEDYYEKS